MDPQQFEEISLEMLTLHKSMKNIFGMSFAISPLLALSTSGWYYKTIQGTYLLRVSIVFVVFLTLINNLKAFHRSWQQPSRNPYPSGRSSTPGYYWPFGGEISSGSHGQS